MNSLDTPTKTKVKPSSYNAVSFHGVRCLSAISSLVVGGILAFFCVALKNDGYKVPFTFLIGVLLAAITLIVLTLTLCIHLCMRLSPLFNLILNVPLLIGWLVITGLLGYNIYGTLAHSCTLTNWGNNDGIMICQQYKALFSFVIFATLSQIAMIIVDVRARIAQNRSGKYAQMDSTSQLKLEPYDNTLNRQPTFQDAPFPQTRPQRRETYEQQHDQFTANYEYHDDQPGWRPGQRTETNDTPYAAQAVARKPVARADTTASSNFYMTRTDTLASSQNPPHRSNTVVSSQYGEMPYRGNTPVSSQNSHYGEVPHRNNTVASSHYSDVPAASMPMPHRNNTVASSHYNDYSDIGGRGGQQQVRMQLSDYDNYQHPAQSTAYDSSYGQQQYTAYNPRY